jgi:prepilin-type processing-associated H-X9-DG protein
MSLVTPSRRGLTVTDVVVAVVIVGIVFLVALSLIPRQRENARGVSCQNNLRQIGTAIIVFANDHDGALPKTPEFQPIDSPATPGVLANLLGELGYADLSGLVDVATAPPRRRGEIPPPRRIRGFLCPSDPVGFNTPFPGPVSYRASVGSLPDGGNGAFAPGKIVRLKAIESADGLEYTAAFSERLLGDARSSTTGSSRAYAISMRPLTNEHSCPNEASAPRPNDAGRSWVDADWRSSYYNHAITPNAPASCIAGDGKSALLGASSGHGGRVNVLLLDGGVRWITSNVDPIIWAQLANINDRGAESKPRATTPSRPAVEPGPRPPPSVPNARVPSRPE